MPILLSDTKKIEALGFNKVHTVIDIIIDQLDHYLAEKERKGSYCGEGAADGHLSGLVRISG
ncbi:MAG: hypothetical protein LUO89_00305 [Methanothrix sp.]|nr:hypothetical protein [Methanothrix sp.]